MDKLYRAEIRNYEEVFTPEVEYKEFNILSETPCGYWIQFRSKRKWVDKTSRKRFAYPTQKEALNALLFRRLFYDRFLELRLSGNKKVIELVQSQLKEREEVNHG